MPRNGLLSVFASLALLAAACGGSSSAQDDAAVQDDAGPKFDTNLPQDAGQPDAPGGNHDFETAKAVTVDSTTAVSDAVNPAGDVNYYKFDGTAGEWMLIYTVADQLPTPSDADTVITLYDQNHTQIALDDDAPLAASYDSEIIIRLPTTGTYYFTVQEYSSWNTAETPVGGTTYKYQVFVGHLREECTTDAEPNDAVGEAQAVTWFPPDSSYPEIRQTLLLGTYASASDTDVYAFTVEAGTAAWHYVTFEIMPSGANTTTVGGGAYGSTAPVGEFYITDSTGATVIAKIDNSTTGATTGLWAPLSPGDYKLWVKHPATALGTNDFYVAALYIDYYLMGDLETEAVGATGANDTLATAQALTVEASSSNPDRNRAAVMAPLAAGDVDYYSFTVRPTDTNVTVLCSAARDGSGLTGLTVSVRNSSDTEITGGQAVETAATDLSLKNLNPGAGTYYLRLSATGQSATVTSNFVHCTVMAEPAA
jgi:hypothetical protein